jgi:PTH1 family peptidyl-tRNA hydrolase
MAIDAVAQKFGARIDRARFKALCGECEIAGSRVLLMKPQTFMNLSGEAVGEALRFYKIEPKNVIVLSDDISLDCGKLRVRRKGSAGGHNGLKSIIEHLGSDGFPRIKIGVGQKPSPDYDLVDWVLGKFPKDAEAAIAARLGDIRTATELMIRGEIDLAMNRFSK